MPLAPGGSARIGLAVYVANLLGPTPPSTSAVAGSAEALWRIVVWGFWVDRHREAAGAHG